jgi:hypothetical protein
MVSRPGEDASAASGTVLPRRWYRGFNVCALGFAVFLTGCVTGPSAPDEDRIRVYADVSYSLLFEAFERTFLQWGIQSTASEKNKGVLNGKMRLTSQLASARLPGKRRLIYTYYKIIFLQTEGEGVKVQLDILTSYEDGSIPSEGEKGAYDLIWEAVRQNL